MRGSTYSFQVSGQPRLELRNQRGDVRIREHTGSAIEVVLDGSDKWVSRVTVEQVGDGTVRIEPEGKFGFGSGIDMVVTVPAGTDAKVSLGSGDLMIDVDAGDLEASLGSGDVKAGLVRGDAEIKTASGDVRLDEVKGDLAVSVASGDVRVREVQGDVKAKSASGDILMERVVGRVEGSTAAGDITVRSFGGSDLRVNALSGDVILGIPRGRTLEVELKTMTGDVINELEASSGERTGTATLQVKTLAGDIRLRPAG